MTELSHLTSYVNAAMRSQWVDTSWLMVIALILLLICWLTEQNKWKK